MKTITVVIFLAFLSIKSFAACTSYEITAWPRKEMIKENTVFIIEGYAKAREVIEGLNTKYPVYLRSGITRIPLKVTSTHAGQFQITQAVLHPEGKLIAGAEYELVIDNRIENNFALQRWNEAKKIYEPVKWKVEAGVDKVNPAWKELPKFAKKTYNLNGCGPDYHVIFDYKAADTASEYIIKTTVTSLKENKSTTYYLSPFRNQIYVGRGMCSGAFTFNTGDDYEVEFELVDMSGNTTKWEGKKIKFTRPVP